MKRYAHSSPNRRAVTAVQYTVPYNKTHNTRLVIQARTNKIYCLSTYFVKNWQTATQQRTQIRVRLANQTGSAYVSEMISSKFLWKSLVSNFRPQRKRRCHCINDANRKYFYIWNYNRQHWNSEGKSSVFNQCEFSKNVGKCSRQRQKSEVARLAPNQRYISISSCRSLSRLHRHVFIELACLIMRRIGTRCEEIFKKSLQRRDW